MLHAAQPPLTAARRGQLCVGFTGLNLGLGVIATELIPKGPVATAVQALFLFFVILGAVWDVRLWRRHNRAGPQGTGEGL